MIFINILRGNVRDLTDLTNTQHVGFILTELRSYAVLRDVKNQHLLYGIIL